MTATALTAVTPIAVDIFADFALNDASENEGVYVAYRDDVEFLVARTNNRNFKKRISHLVKKNQRLIDSGTAAAEAKSTEIMIEVMASTILLGWKGSLTVKGVPLPYSLENAKKLLGIPLFREWVGKQAEDIQSYKAVQDEEDEKN